MYTTTVPSRMAVTLAFKGESLDAGLLITKPMVLEPCARAHSVGPAVAHDSTRECCGSSRRAAPDLMLSSAGTHVRCPDVVGAIACVPHGARSPDEVAAQGPVTVSAPK